MENIFVYPGCFTPPTYGHFQIAKRAAEIFPQIIIICSTNDAKNATRWFCESECKEMWTHYDLPKNVLVKTFSEYSKEKVDFKNLVMIRGIRDENDMENEQRVMKLNKEMFGIDKIFYLLADDKCKDISASKTRKATIELDFETLSHCVSPPIITCLLEKSLKVQNIFIVVGKTGAGKTTFLSQVAEINKKAVCINTDEFSKSIRPLIEQHFGKDVDLITLAAKRDEELSQVIRIAWFDLLKDALSKVPQGADIFLEIPYGLRSGKDLFRYLGNKIVYIGCENEKVNYERIVKRGTKKHSRLIETIPGLDESRLIAEKNKLEMYIVDTSGRLEDLPLKAGALMRKINSKGA